MDSRVFGLMIKYSNETLSAYLIKNSKGNAVYCIIISQSPTDRASLVSNIILARWLCYVGVHDHSKGAQLKITGTS